MGIKPLYCRKLNDGFIFSSEIASILEMFNDDFDEFGIRQYKKLRMTLKGHTFYKNTKMFPAGHYFLNGQIHKYWELNYSPKDPISDEELKWLIEDSVKIRRRSDVPVGSYLSGGLDSTILSYILDPDHTWTVGFDDLNEFEWSQLAADNLHGRHHKTVVNAEQFLDITDWIVRKRKEPLAVPNEVLLYIMTKEVKKENTVILSGEGADELFWGYDIIFKWAHTSKEITIDEFDKYYCYGSEKDDEVIDFALNDLPEETVENKVGYFFQIHHLHGLLRRVDNSTMLCSVEARVPFVDHRLVERLAGVPFSWKMGDTFKEPMKRIFKDLIPQKIIERKKVGFPVPLDKIFGKVKNELNALDAWFNYNLGILRSIKNSE